MLLFEAKENFRTKMHSALRRELAAFGNICGIGAVRQGPGVIRMSPRRGHVFYMDKAQVQSLTQAMPAWWDWEVVRAGWGALLFPHFLEGRFSSKKYPARNGPRSPPSCSFNHWAIMPQVWRVKLKQIEDTKLMFFEMILSRKTE